MNRIFVLLAPTLLLSVSLGCGAKTAEPEATAEETTQVEEAAEEATHADHVQEAEEGGVATPKSACEGCAKGKSGETAWCSGCNAGYHDGEKIKCEGCWKAAQNGETHAHDEPEEAGTESSGG